VGSLLKQTQSTVWKKVGYTWALSLSSQEVFWRYSEMPSVQKNKNKINNNNKIIIAVHRGVIYL